MPARNLKIDQLELDTANPRFNKADGQPEAMQRLLEDQDYKLANLAESIVEDGLNPMDRLLVIASEKRAGKFIVIEGNRRTAALKILRNPALLTGLDIRLGLHRRFAKLSEAFDMRAVEPIPCFEVTSRQDANVWLEQRHSGENEGRGIVSWSGLAGSRFRGSDPALQALDFVRLHAELSENQKELLDGKFPITTLDRLLSTPAVRSTLGFEIKDNKLLTALPLEEALKPLRRIVLDLAEKKINVTSLKLRAQQMNYVSNWNSGDTPNLSKQAAEAVSLDTMTPTVVADVQTTEVKPAVSRTNRRLYLVPRTCKLQISNPKAEEIFTELRSLRLDKHPNAVAVLLRVFMEISVDHYLTTVAIPPIPLTTPTGGGPKEKPLMKRIEDAMEYMILQGASKKELAGVRRGISVKTHPLSVDLLHAYVHSQFLRPTERDLAVAWDSAQPFFDRIWI